MMKKPLLLLLAMASTALADSGPVAVKTNAAGLVTTPAQALFLSGNHLVLGTDLQAQNTTLQAIAGNAAGGNAGTFGLTFLGMPDAVTARSTAVIREPRAGLAYTFGKASAGTWPINIAMVGDSIINNKRGQIENGIAAVFGIAGFGIEELTFSISSGATANTSDFTTWPSGLTCTVPSGGICTFQYSGSIPVMGDRVKIYYVQTSGAGTFKVQTQVNGGSWTDETGFTSVSAAGSTAGKILSITKGSAGLMSARVVGLSGNVTVIGAAIYRSGYHGAIISNFAQGGVGITAMLTANTAILNPIIADIQPDLMIYGQNNGSTGFATNFPAFRTMYQGGYSSMDWLYFARNPGTLAGDPDAYADSAAMRKYALANADTFFDGCSPFVTSALAASNGYLAGDGVHTTGKGDQFITSLMFDQIFGAPEAATVGPLYLDGPRLASPIVISGGVIGGGANLSLVSSATSGDAITLGRADGFGRAQIIATSDTDTPPNAFSISSNQVGFLLVNNGGNISLGYGPPSAAFAQVEVHNANPGNTLLGLQNVANPALSDFIECRTGNGTQVAWVDSTGAYNGPLLKLAPAAAPSSPNEGWLYPDSTTHKPTYRTNSGWITLASTADIPAAANPSTLIGLTATNGTSANWERSDATHALDQSITPTWTGLHTFGAGLTSTGLITASTAIKLFTGASPSTPAEGWIYQDSTTHRPTVRDNASTWKTLLAVGDPIASSTVTGNTAASSAASGIVGEFITSAVASGSAVSLVTATAKTVTSISLTAGDWDVWGVVDFHPASTTTASNFEAGESTTTNAMGSQDQFASAVYAMPTGTTIDTSMTCPTTRINVSTTTTVFLTCKASFLTSTMTAYGTISARRRW